MYPAAFRRARKLLADRSGTVFVARLLGALQALLTLKLLVVCGLLLSLITTRGVAHLSAAQLTPEQVARLPRWVSGEVGVRLQAEATLLNKGLYGLASANQLSSNPAHRLGARLLEGLLRRCAPLRDNIGSLKVLLALGLTLLLSLAYLIQWRRSVTTRLTGQAAAALRRQIHRQMYRLGQSSLPGESVGPLTDLFTREVNDVREGLMADLEHEWRVPIFVLGLLAIALFVSVKLSVFFLSLGALVALASRPLNRSSLLAADAAVRDSAVQLCLLHEDLGMLRTVRVYGMEEVDKQRFDEHLERYQAADDRRINTEGHRNPTTLLLVGAAAFLAVGLLAYNVIDERVERISAASALVLAGSLLGLARPILDTFDWLRIVRRAGRSAGGIFQYLERKPELLQSVGAQFLAPLRERITFENVTLDAPTGRTLLSGVSAEIPAKTRTAVLSLEEPSKHALACLIPRLIDPKVGRVRMDGIDLREITLESLRAQVATVLQADLVFSDTVFANIGLGDPSFGLPRIIEAAKVAHAHNFIQDLPHGYDTVVGPLGHYLRADEQYRIALARAFLHDPSIVIIEEPTESLDDDTKHLIDDTIDRLAANRTLIFLPHRLSTIRKCDQVLILHNGRVEAAGAPSDLQSQNKLYRHIQYVEFNQFATGEIEAGQMND